MLGEQSPPLRVPPPPPHPQRFSGGVCNKRSFSLCGTFSAPGLSPPSACAPGARPRVVLPGDGATGPAGKTLGVRPGCPWAEGRGEGVLAIASTRGPRVPPPQERGEARGAASPAATPRAPWAARAPGVARGLGEPRAGEGSPGLKDRRRGRAPRTPQPPAAPRPFSGKPAPPPPSPAPRARLSPRPALGGARLSPAARLGARSARLRGRCGAAGVSPQLAGPAPARPAPMQAIKCVVVGDG